MKVLKITITTLCFLLQTASFVNAQVAINTSGTSPEASAMLDVSSSDKGILIPRMDSISRNNIVSPATGLMVYDTNNNSFWYYNGTTWTSVGSATAFTSENGITKSNNNSDDFLFGADSLDWSSGSVERKMFFDKSKGAFRVGSVYDDEWDENNIGSNSFATGYNSKASGSHSAAFSSAEASGIYSTAFSGGEASGFSSFAFSDGTANGGYSTAFNNGTANASYSIAANNGTASGNYSIAIGFSNEALSYAEIVLGTYNTTYSPNNTTSFNSSDRLFVIGNGTADAARSDAMIVYKSGNTNINGDLTISGDLILEDTIGFVSKDGLTYSVNNDDDFLFGTDSLFWENGTEHKMFFNKSKGAFRAGTVTNANWDESNLGDYSTAFGYNTTASGYYSTAFGSNTTASGFSSTAFGSNTTASDPNSTAFGEYTTASGYGSTTFGVLTIASGATSTAFGYGATASGDYSTAFGGYITARSYGEVAIGLYNTNYTPNSATYFDSDDRLFVIGNGTNNNARSDAFIVYKNGNTEINGDLTISGDLILADTIGFISKDGLTYSVNNDDDFLFGADSLNYGNNATEYKVFFDKSKGAFRAGSVFDDEWDESNLGDNSFAAGQGSKASGNYSVAFNGRATAFYSVAFSSGQASGESSTAFNNGQASGRYSTAFGLGIQAPSYSEIALGTYNTTYSPNNTTSFDSSDRLFVIGNGTNASRSDAMIIYKNGNTEINGDLTISGDLILADTIGFVSKDGLTYSVNNDDDFLFGADNLDWSSGTEYKMFFDKSKGAFRVGSISSTNWDESNLGNYSFAVGVESKAVGESSAAFSAGIANGFASTAFGFGTANGNYSFASNEGIANGLYATAFNWGTANGYNSIAFGLGSETASFNEIAIGTYNTTYTPNDTSSFDSSDRLFVIGNGTADASRSDAMIVYKSGNTEINGTLSMSDNLVLNNNDIRIRASTDLYHGLGHRSTFASQAMDGPVLYGFGGGALGTNRNGTELIALIWNSNGNVAIGGTLNNNAKFEVDGSNSLSLTAQYYNSSGNTANQTNTRNLSAYFSDHIACEELQVFSDKRMKNVLSISSSKDDLNRLMQIEVTNYQMKDTIGQGNKTIKKVIAQQVAEVYPEAVSKNITRVIPDIYRLCPIENGWISWNPEVSGQVEAVKIGDRVQLITKNTTKIYEVLDIKAGAFKVALDQEEEVFVYGREVKDFHTVDYEAISMLNVSATQELAKENGILKSQILKTELEISKLKAQVARIDDLERLINQLQVERSN